VIHIFKALLAAGPARPVVGRATSRRFVLYEQPPEGQLPGITLHPSGSTVAVSAPSPISSRRTECCASSSLGVRA
jgi:hypothetical protein